MYATYTGEKFPESKGHEYLLSQEVTDAYIIEQLNHIRNGKPEYLCSLNEYVSEKIDNHELQGVRAIKSDRRLTLYFIYP